MGKKNYWFKVLLALDYLLNALLKGKIGVYLSTRAYVNAERGKPKWIKIRKWIDRVFWEGHCEDSFKGEMFRKRKWIEQHEDLL